MTQIPRYLSTNLSVLDRYGLTSLQIVPATAISSAYYPRIDPEQPLLIVECATTPIDALIRRLQAVYPPSHHVIQLSPAGVKEGSLADLQSGPTSPDVSEVLLLPMSEPASFGALQEIIAHLRAPEGCPWDRELTWTKLRSSLLEESHELLAALDEEDPEEICEELGDLLLQIGLQLQIAIELGAFRLSDIISGIVSKLVRRHPHVFGEERVESTEEVLENWEAIKRAERERNGAQPSPLASIPVDLPALALAQAYLDRMARLGTIETPPTPAVAIASLQSASDIDEQSVGEALLELVSWVRAQGIDAESALRGANARLAERVAAGLVPTSDQP